MISTASETQKISAAFPCKKQRRRVLGREMAYVEVGEGDPINQSTADGDMSFPENSAVVVAHDAWADGSSWKDVILPLSKQGLDVVAAPPPLISLSDDIVAPEPNDCQNKLQMHDTDLHY
jgi:hypothetical protein